MSITRIINPNEIKSAHVAMLGLVILALFGNCLLTSAGKPNILPDGAVDWSPDSILLALVEILDLNYSQPTPNGIAIKSLVQGVAGGIGILIAGLGIFALSRSQDVTDASDTCINIDELSDSSEAGKSISRRQLNPIYTAQVSLILFTIWSFVSVLWAHAPDFSYSGSVLLATQVVWPFALAYGLNRRAAVLSGYIMVLVLLMTAILAVLYHAERNPTLRASYPIGNPLFLGSCLIPGFLLAVSAVNIGFKDYGAKKSAKGVLKVILCLAALAIICYAFYLTKSRGPALGLAMGIAAFLFFSGGRRTKVLLTVLTIAGIAGAGYFFFEQINAPSSTGRSASMRTRFYTWNYAANLIQESPAIGHGQGAYALLADGYAANDVINDPAALEYRITHAHNEWLETGADLGIVGLVIVLAAILLTLMGGAKALAHMNSPSQRWMMIGLLSSLVALTVAECFSVGLRITGVPLVYFTIIGLIWSLSTPTSEGWQHRVARNRTISTLVLIFSIAIGLFVAENSRRDFAAARAMYDINNALDVDNINLAHKLADRSYEDRLSPARKLSALQQKTQTYLRTAEILQNQYLRRLEACRTSQTQSTILRKQMLESRQECEYSILKGLENLAQLQSVSASDLARGWLGYGFHKQIETLATFDQATEIAAKNKTLAIKALEQQIVRQPYNTQLAAKYVLEGFDKLEPEAVMELLARPLRINRIPSFYLEILTGVSQTPAYDRVVVPILENAQAQVQHGASADWTDPWAPEKLRLGAVACFSKPDYPLAVEYLQVAVKLYELLPDMLLARSSCHAELADARFFAHPENSVEAIKEAENSLVHIPGGETGRSLRDAIANRLITYHLAAGHEDFSRKLLSEQKRNLNEAQAHRAIAAKYVELAYSVFNQASKTMPEKLDEWSARAIALDSESAPAWFLAADVAANHKDDKKVVECLNNAITTGGEPENIIGAIKRALRVMPDSKILQGMANHVLSQLQPTDSSTGADNSNETP